MTNISRVFSGPANTSLTRVPGPLAIQVECLVFIQNPTYIEFIALHKTVKSIYSKALPSLPGAVKYQLSMGIL